MSDNTTSDSFPFTKHLTSITKQYYGVISKKLQDLDIERYYYTLVLIAESKAQLTQQMLAEKLTIDKVTMVRIVDYLSKKGYVTRMQNPDDRRQYILEITPKGKKTVPQIRKAFCETNQAAFLGLSPEEADSFLRCVEIIKSNLAEIPALDVDLKFNRTSKKSNKLYESKQFSDAR